MNPFALSIISFWIVVAAAGPRGNNLSLGLAVIACGVCALVLIIDRFGRAA